MLVDQASTLPSKPSRERWPRKQLPRRPRRADFDDEKRTDDDARLSRKRSFNCVLAGGHHARSDLSSIVGDEAASGIRSEMLSNPTGGPPPGGGTGSGPSVLRPCPTPGRRRADALVEMATGAGPHRATVRLRPASSAFSSADETPPRSDLRTVFGYGGCAGLLMPWLDEAYSSGWCSLRAPRRGRAPPPGCSPGPRAGWSKSGTESACIRTVTCGGRQPDIVHGIVP